MSELGYQNIQTENKAETLEAYFEHAHMFQSFQQPSAARTYAKWTFTDFDFEACRHDDLTLEYKVLSNTRSPAYEVHFMKRQGNSKHHYRSSQTMQVNDNQNYFFHISWVDSENHRHVAGWNDRKA